MARETKISRGESFIPPLWIITVTGVVLGIWLMVQLKEIVMLLVVGYAIAFILDPVLDWCERRRIPRHIAVLLVFLLTAILLFLLFLTVIPTLIREIKLLTESFPEYINIVRNWSSNLVSDLRAIVPARWSKQILDLSPSSIFPGFSSQTLNSIFSGLISALLGGYSITLTILNIALLPFCVYYLSVDFDSFHRWILGLFPRKSRKMVRLLGSEMYVHATAFVRGQVIVGCILFVCYLIGLSLIGVRFWFLLAIISGFGNLIPYIGFLVGITLSLIMALVTFGDFYHLGLVILVYGVVQALESFLITPRIVGESVGLSPLLVIIALFAGGALFGLLGIFLAVPVAACLKVLSRHAHSKLMARLEED